MTDGASTKPMPDKPHGRLDGSPHAQRYWAVVVDGADRGKSHVIEVGSTVVVGSHADADFRLTDLTVSRFHLELSARPDGIQARDLGSSNGTFAGGARVQELLVPLTTTLQVGGTVLRISREDEELQKAALGGAHGFGDLVGASEAMRRLFALLPRVAASDATVLLHGESGTGKDLIARAIHAGSERRQGPFVVVDCASLQPSLAESELFGHEEGAFTGAVAARMGVFQRAHGGTLFLDEVGELPLELQPKLLRALEARTVRPLGAAKDQPVDVRIVAATHHALDEKVARSRFRSDLYYRLAVVLVSVPSLRERRGDIPLLVDHFAIRAGRPGAQFPRALLEQWAQQPWPGNVRELRNAVERALLEQGAVQPGPRAGAKDEGPLPFRDAKERFTREYLEQLLARHGGNVSEAAAAAGLARTYLHAMLKKAGLIRR